MTQAGTRVEHIKKEDPAVVQDGLLSAWGKFIKPKEVLVHPDDMPLLEEAGVAEGAIPCTSVARGTVVLLRDRGDFFAPDSPLLKGDGW